MKKISVVIILSVGFLTVTCFWAVVNAKADDSAVTQGDNQVLNDEGYGNADAEYYNSADDRDNDEEGTQNQAIGDVDEGPSGPQGNFSTHAH